MGLDIGQLAPDFLLPSSEGVNTSLTTFEGKNIVLYFYPKDDTPGCTIEAKGFSILSQEFIKKDTVIVGISKDKTKSHTAFKAKYGLDVILLSDEENTTAYKYDVMKEKNMFGKTYMGVVRSTFLISKERVILKIWNSVSPKGHADAVLQAVQELT